MRLCPCPCPLAAPVPSASSGHSVPLPARRQPQLTASMLCSQRRSVPAPPSPPAGSLPLKLSPACGACPTPATCQTTAFTCVFRCFPCDPSCGSASWATPEFTQRSVAPMVKMTRSKTFQAYLPSCHRTYSCIHCRAHLANHDELISKVRA